MNLDLIYDDIFEVREKVDFIFLKNKTVFLTGATGLVGTYFLATLALLNEGGMNIKVFAECHSEPADFTKQIAEWGNINLIRNVLYFSESVFADVILHCSGFAQPQVFTANPAETIRVNTAVTQALLGRLNPGGKFLFISSSEVYNGFEGNAKETDLGTTTPNHPRACYIQSKLCGETIVNVSRQVGVDAKSARLCLAYGPGTREHDTRAVNSFIERALTQGKIALMDSGAAIRTYCYISDAIEQMWNITLHGRQEVYNVGGHSECSIHALAKFIGAMTQAEVTTADKGLTGAPGQVRMDLTRIETEFPKESYVTLIEGLQNTINWQRELYKDGETIGI